MKPKIDVLTQNNVQIKGKSDARVTLLFAHGFGTDQFAWKEGHTPHVSYPAEVTQAIGTFVDQIPDYGLEPV